MSPSLKAEFMALYIETHEGLADAKASLLDPTPSERRVPITRAENAELWAVARLEFAECAVKPDTRGGWVVASPRGMKARCRTGSALVRLADAVEKKGAGA